MKKHTKMLICLFAAVLYLMIGASVWADTASGFPDAQQGSITIHMKDVDSGEAVPGGTVCFYQVAEPKDGNWVYLDTFAECNQPLDDLGAADLSSHLERYALDYEIKGREIAVGKDAELVIADLPAGLYLVSQVKPAEGYSSFRPFLVSVPTMEDGDYIFDVDATPKIELEKETTPTPPTPPTPTPPTPRLPQTGQLWWPVLALAGAGILLILAGMRSKNRRREKDVTQSAG